MNSKMLFMRCNCIVILTTLYLFSPHSHAFSFGITVKGKVIAPPCTINDGNDLAIGFGSGLIAESIDGKNYEIPIPYSLHCPHGSPTSLKMKITGFGSLYDPTLLRTSKNNLAIMLKSNGHKLDLDKWTYFNYPAKPTLTAVLTRNASGRITLGYFFSTATLMVDYQ
ncbi:fimbrial protein [Erwiniaceae bacterium L1_54_3]|nr:fimbrial protein [Erwiniaceae bacterium L1_54_3]